MPSQPEVQVRLARPADEEALSDLDAVAWSSLSGFPSVLVPAGGGHQHRFFDAENPPQAHLVACDGPTVIGYVRLKPPTRLPENAHVLQVSGLAVHPAARRRGAGAALLAACEPEALRRGARKISLRVLSTNEPAIRLYERLGYIREGVLRDEFSIDGAFVDDIVMAKHLLP